MVTAELKELHHLGLSDEELVLIDDTPPKPVVYSGEPIDFSRKDRKESHIMSRRHSLHPKYKRRDTARYDSTPSEFKKTSRPLNLESLSSHLESTNYTPTEHDDPRTTNRLFNALDDYFVSVELKDAKEWDNLYLVSRDVAQQLPMEDGKYVCTALDLALLTRREGLTIKEMGESEAKQKIMSGYGKESKLNFVYPTSNSASLMKNIGTITQLDIDDKSYSRLLDSSISLPVTSLNSEGEEDTSGAVMDYIEGRIAEKPTDDKLIRSFMDDGVN